MRTALRHRDKTLKVWDPVIQKAGLTLRGHEEGVTAAAFTGGGAGIVSTALDGTIRVWMTADAGARE